MTTQIQDQPSTLTSTPQGSHHYVLSLEKPGSISGSWNGTYTPPAGATRQECYTAIKAYIEAQNPAITGAVVIFFSFEPNAL